MLSPMAGPRWPHSSSVSLTRSEITAESSSKAQNRISLEPMRPRDENLESASERISRDPGFVRAGDVLPARLDRGCNALTSSGWDAFGFKDRDGHCDRGATLSPTSGGGTRPSASFERPPFSCAPRPKSSVSPSWASPQRWSRQNLEARPGSRPSLLRSGLSRPGSRSMLLGGCRSWLASRQV